MKRWLKITVIVLLTVSPLPVLGASSKHALIIGNSTYKNVPLKNPVNDANDMASTLEQLGFTVLKKTNVDQQTIEHAFREFEQQLQTNDIALFYFSGHGIQIDGINYLLPIGADIYSADEIKYKAVNANMVLDKLQNAGTQLNIIILDACRNNPFKQFRSLERGLAIMSASTGTIISYATAPGSVAYDGDERNSPYTKHLLKTMQTPGLEIEKVFKQVRIAVKADTGGKQVPWESSSLTGDFMFVTHHDREMIIQASQRWQNSEIAVKMGDIVTMTYISGQWSTWPEWDWLPSPYTGPEGHVGVADTKYPGSVGPFLLPGAEIMALLYRIGVNGSVGAVGKKITFTAKDEGFLWFSANDDNFGDNKGSLIIRVTIE